MKAITRLILTIGTILVSLVSCYKGQIDDLQTQIDEIKNTQIKTVSEQRSGIEISLTDLEKLDAELKDFISTLQSQSAELEKIDKALEQSVEYLKTELDGDASVAQANCLAQMEAFKIGVHNKCTSLKTSASSLQEKDDALKKQTAALKSYIEKEMGETSDWTSVTFSTLAQYNATAEIVAAIHSLVTSITDDMKVMSVGVSQEDLNNSIDGLRKDIRSKVKKSADDAFATLSQTAKKVTSAYTKAFSDAIKSSESSIRTWVNPQFAGYYTIAQIDSKLSTLKAALELRDDGQRAYLSTFVNNLSATLAAKISSNDTQIEHLQGQSNRLGTDLAALADAVLSNSTTISGNASLINANSTAISNGCEDIALCEKLIEANKRLSAENDRAVESSANAVRTLQTSALADDQKLVSRFRDVATNASDIASTASLLATAASAVASNALAINANSEGIGKLKDELARTKEEIIDAYNRAIEEAISAFGGRIRGEIAAEVSKINGIIEALTGRVAACEKEIESIKDSIEAIKKDIESVKGQISAILSRVQSIFYVPKYSDSKAVMTYTETDKINPGFAEFDFEVKPAAVAAELAEVWQGIMSMKAVYTITKAAPEMVELALESVTAENGFLSVTVSGKALKDEFFKGLCSANVRLSISDGNNDLATEYIQMVPQALEVISFEDEAFKGYCVENFDTDGDGEINVKYEAKAVTAMSCSNRNITSLVGIEHFVNLKSLDCSNNPLAQIDILKNKEISTLCINACPITSMKFSGYLSLGGQFITLPGDEKAIIYYAEDSKLRLVSLDETTLGWGYEDISSNARDEFDGVVNTDKIISGSPAAQWCRAKGAEWYLPSRRELFEIYRSRVAINATLTSFGAQTLSPSSYWSSTEYNYNNAYLVFFKDGGVTQYYKWAEYKVRAVRVV